MTDNHERCVGRAKIRRRPNQIISRIANRIANMSLGIFYGFQRGVFLQALNWKTFLLMSSFPKPPLSDLCAKRDYSITSFFGNVFVLHKVGKPAQKKPPTFQLFVHIHDVGTADSWRQRASGDSPCMVEQRKCLARTFEESELHKGLLATSYSQTLIFLWRAASGIST